MDSATSNWAWNDHCTRIRLPAGPKRATLMSIVRDGSPASEGIAQGPVVVVSWGVPTVPHRTLADTEIEAEVDRFNEARAWTRERLLELMATAEGRLGTMEARIFEPQILMLDDVEVADPTIRYIRENRLAAERALEWRMLELQARWTRTAHPMVLDKLNDVQDLQVRLLQSPPGSTGSVGPDLRWRTRHRSG